MARWKMLIYRFGRLASQDIGLDTFAVNGMTTGLDLAHAGLPVVATVGERMNTRFSAMVAWNLGMQPTVRTTLKEYEDVSCSLAFA